MMIHYLCNLLIFPPPPKKKISGAQNVANVELFLMLMV
jgi:hypothetical protein